MILKLKELILNKAILKYSYLDIAKYHLFEYFTES